MASLMNTRHSRFLVISPTFYRTVSTYSVAKNSMVCITTINWYRVWVLYLVESVKSSWELWRWKWRPRYAFKSREMGRYFEIINGRNWSVHIAETIFSLCYNHISLNAKSYSVCLRNIPAMSCLDRQTNSSSHLDMYYRSCFTTSGTWCVHCFSCSFHPFADASVIDYLMWGTLGPIEWILREIQQTSKL